MAIKFGKPKYRAAIAISIYLQILLWGSLIGLVVSLSSIGIAAVDIVLRPAAILLFVSVGLISHLFTRSLTTSVFPLGCVSDFSHLRRQTTANKSIQRECLYAYQETCLYPDTSDNRFGHGMVNHDGLEFDRCRSAANMPASWCLGRLLASRRALHCTTFRDCNRDGSLVSKVNSMPKYRFYC